MSLAIMVSVWAYLVFLANFENPMLYKVGMALHPIETKKFLSGENISGEKEAYKDVTIQLREQPPAQASSPPTPFPETPNGTLPDLLNMKLSEKPKESLTIPEIKRRLEVPQFSTTKTFQTHDRLPFLKEKGRPVAEVSSTAKMFLSTSTRKKIREQLKKQAIELGLEPRLALSMAKVESGYDPRAVSPKGAVGVLQVMPRFAWEDYRVDRERLFDPEVNIRIGLSRMKYLLNRFNHDLDLSLAAYNAGASRVVKAGYKVPSIKETQAYVRKVKEIMENEA